MDEPNQNTWTSRSRRDISIVVDNDYEDQDELTRDYKHGSNTLMNSMRDVIDDQDQIYRSQSHLNSTRNRNNTYFNRGYNRQSSDLDFNHNMDFERQRFDARADSKQLQQEIKKNEELLGKIEFLESEIEKHGKNHKETSKNLQT